MFWRKDQGWQIKTVLRVIGESKEKIGECSGGRFKGGRARQFCESLASQRRRLANVLARGPRLTERYSLEVFGMVHHRDRHHPPSQAHLGLFGRKKKVSEQEFRQPQHHNHLTSIDAKIDHRDDGSVHSSTNFGQPAS